jgi:hypothetical protein
MNVDGTIAPAPLSAIGEPALPEGVRPARLRCCGLDTCLLALRVASLLAALAAVTAGAIRLLAAASARRWLHYPFTGVPARFGEAVSIFAHNARALGGVFGLLLIVQVALRDPARAGRAQRTLRSLGELLLAGLVAANVLIVGAGLGAYGTRMVRAMLPHGPVELAAFATALALYLHGRQRRLSIRELALTGAVSVALLAAAAALETFVTV